MDRIIEESHLGKMPCQALNQRLDGPIENQEENDDGCEARNFRNGTTPLQLQKAPSCSLNYSHHLDNYVTHAGKQPARTSRLKNWCTTGNLPGAAAAVNG